ncbi:glutaredoxin family protein [Aliikangiella sp. IMCC44359]|uniref:glutaredoxin family protein n=1 Tax=Aliikangiella sp. IMCC44359 TaxID=3459125 RepID=UPI00403A8056
MSTNKNKRLLDVGLFLGFFVFCFVSGYFATVFFKESIDNKPDYVHMDLQEAFKGKEELQVIVLGADWCVACKATKALLNEHKINFLFIDVEKKENRNHPLVSHIKDSYPVILMPGIKINGYQKQVILDNLSSKI